MWRQPVSLWLCVIWVNHHEKDHPTAGLPFTPAPVFCHVPTENKARFQRLMWGYKARHSLLDSLDREIVSADTHRPCQLKCAQRSTIPLSLLDGMELLWQWDGPCFLKAQPITREKELCSAVLVEEYTILQLLFSQDVEREYLVQKGWTVFFTNAKRGQRWITTNRQQISTQTGFIVKNAQG